MFDLITIGDSLVDIFFIIDESNSDCTLDKDKRKLCFNYAEKMYIDKSTHAVGGNAANVAVGARKLGLSTAIATDIGDDINGQVVLDALVKAKVDTSLVTIHKNQETRYSVVLNYAGERTILSYHAPRTYTVPTFPQARWLYYTSLSAQFEPVQKAVLQYKKAHPEVHIAMNPGSYQINRKKQSIIDILPHLSVCIVNKEEALKLTGKQRRTSVSTLLTLLRKKGPRTVVITDSTRGAYAFDGTVMLHMPSFPLKAKGKTGAGDAFTSGFLTATIQGKSLEDAMLWGTANAGGVIQEFGAQKGLQTKKGIETFIAAYPAIRPVTLP